MRYRVLLVTVLLAASGCGLSGSTGQTVSSSARLAATAAPTPEPTLDAAVLVGTSSVDTSLQVVSIVSPDGHTLASTRAARRTRLAQHPSVYFPSVSASDHRVYYLDGDTEIKSLDVDGTTRHVTQVPGSATAYAVFAVSPDELRIAVSVFDYTTNPVLLRLYVEDLQGGTNHVDIFKSDVLYVWPIGWHQGKLVMQVGQQPFHGLGSGYTPYGDLPQSLHVVDPGNADRLATMGSPVCSLTGALLSRAGTACYSPNQGSISVVDWNGAMVQFRKGAFAGGASLSPDGTRVAACCFGGPTVVIISSPASGSQETMTAASGYPEDGGWIDDAHVAFRVAGTGNLAILDVKANTVANLQVPGILEARLPGGL